jgi:hypothetical protein
MAAPFRSARRVIQVIHPLDLKGDMSSPLDKGQVAARICDFGQIDYLALFQIHK